MMDKTKLEIDNMNKAQRAGFMHPYTCDRSADGCQVKFNESDGVLIATKDNWVCPCGKYVQNYKKS